MSITEREPVSVLAVPPFNRSVSQFRKSVYRDPGQVTVIIPSVKGDDIPWQVSQMLPGDVFLVNSFTDGELRWSAVLTCPADGVYHVTHG